MKKLRFLSLVAVIGFMISGCVGPAGGAGPDGPTGARGVNGSNGIRVKIFEVDSAKWVSMGTYFDTICVDSDFTDSIRNLVIVNFSDSGINGHWREMPARNVFNNGDQITYAWHWSKAIDSGRTGNIVFFYDNANLNNVAQQTFFHVVVIDQVMRLRHPEVDWKNTDKVMAMPEVQSAIAKAAKK